MPALDGSPLFVRSLARRGGAEFGTHADHQFAPSAGESRSLRSGRPRPRVDGEGSSRAFADGRGAGVAVRCIYSMVDRLLKYKLKLNYNIYRYVPQKASHLPPVLSPIEFSSAHSAYLTSYAYLCSNIEYEAKIGVSLGVYQITFA